MIITGYQGIGKSTFAAKDDMTIDLESSNFWKYEYDSCNKPIEDKKTRDKDWYICYCQVAQDLSRQGYTVFVSCHPEVRQWLAEHSSEYFCTIFPAIRLKLSWIERLEKRYNETKSDKDLKALEHAQKFYDKDIYKLLDEADFGWYSDAIQIRTMDYDIGDFINTFKQTRRERQCHFDVKGETL